MRGYAAVGDAAIVEILVAEFDAGERRWRVHVGRVEAVSFEVDELPVAVTVLIDCIEAGCLIRVDGISCVDRGPLDIKLPSGKRGLVCSDSVSLLEYAVDDTTPAAAPENHGIWTLQNFNPRHVVKITEILDVVTNAIDEEVGIAALAPNDEIVAVGFALMRNHPRSRP